MVYFGIVILLLITIITYIFIEYKEKEYKNYMFWGMSLIIFLLAAFRKGIGYDYNSYNQVYNIIKSTDNPFKNSSFELGYVFINFVSSNFYNVIFISACLGVVIKVILINKFSKEKVLTLLLYFCSIYIMFDIGAIRQGIAISFCLLSIKYILDKSMTKFGACILLGSLFHITALIFIPLYFLGSKELSRRFIYITSIVAILISLINMSKVIMIVGTILPIDFITGKLMYYIQNDGGTLTISLIKRFLIMIIFVEFYKRKNINDKTDWIFLNGYYLSTIFMGILASVPIIGGRGTTNLYFLQIFIFAVIFNEIKNKKIKIIAIIFIAMLFINSIMGPIKDGAVSNQPYIPYKSIFMD